MPIETGAPPIPRSRTTSNRYDAFMHALRDLDGEWASIPLDEIGGETGRDKQRLIIQAARSRGFRVRTTVQQGRLYAHVVAVPSPTEN